MKTYYLRSFGCQMNEHDAERIRALLEAEGLEDVGDAELADVLVFNTCTVRKSADDRLTAHLGDAAAIKRRRPGGCRIIVTGCLPQAEKEALFERFPFVDAALGPQNLYRLPQVLRGAATRGLFADGPHMSGDLPARRARPFQAWVQVMSGCTNRCSYCIVPQVRGPERSRTPETIIAEVGRLAADGVREVTLLGQNVNAYGKDLALSRGAPRPSFAGLMRDLDRIHGLARIRFMTSHPKDLDDDLVAAMAELPAVCEHVHLPAQSGSDRILQAMSREYTATAYLDRVAALRRAVPDISVTTDLIAGFPGESEADFSATLDLVEAASFDAAFTFVFSARQGTKAATMPGQVPDAVKRERVQRLVAVTQRVALQRRQAMVGKSYPVLVEGTSRHGDGLRGRTGQNVTVNFSGHAAPGAIVSVLITDATSTTLRGRA